MLVRQHARTLAYPSLRFLRETQLAAFRRDHPKTREALVVHLGKRRLKIGSVWCLPWQEALRTLGL